MPRRQKSSDSQTEPLGAAHPTAPCVPAIRKAVDDWRAASYRARQIRPRILLNSGSKPTTGSPMAAHSPIMILRGGAIETLIYLYEVARVRHHKDLVERYAGSNKDPSSAAIRRFRPLLR